MRILSDRMRVPSMAKSPARRTLRKVPPATVSNPTMRDTLASTGIMIRSASTVASPLARRFSSPMSFIDRRLALIAYSTRGVANSPLSVSKARRPLPRRFSAIAEGFSSTKDSARSSKLLSDRSTRPFVFKRNASLFRLPSSVTRRSSRAAGSRSVLRTCARCGSGRARQRCRGGL